MSFEAIVSKDSLKAFIDPVAELVDEAKIHLKDDELATSAIDPASVAQIETHLDVSAFESYEADGEAIAINLNRLQDAIGFADSGELVWLTLKQGKLVVEIGDAELTTATIDPEAVRSEPDTSTLDLPTEVVVTGDDLQHAVDVASFADDDGIVSMAWSDVGKLVVAATGDTDRGAVEYERDDLVAARTVEPVRSLFSLEYIDAVASPIDSDADVALRLGEDYPLVVDYNYAEGRGAVTARVAPRVGGGA